VEGAWDVLGRHLIPRLLTARVTAAEQVAAVLAPVKGHAMAKAAVELAMLDAQCKAGDIPLALYLAGRLPGAPAPATRVPAGVAVGLTGSIDELVAEVGTFVAEGYQRVKLKIHPGWDDAPLAELRHVFGPALVLQADANGAYAGLGDPAAALAALDGHDLVCIEQPLADDDMVGHAALSRALTTPVCLDEAVTSLADAETALALGACRVLNIKAGRVGGYLTAVDMAARCAQAGVAVWCGGMLETGVGRAANVALAALAPFTLTGDLSAANRFWEHDIVTAPTTMEPDGTISVPRGPGIGVELRPSALDGAVSREWHAGGTRPV
jgi:O-succinylbenzoate synthase